MKSLKEIKGVGEALREEIVRAYGSEEKAIEELDCLNFTELFYSRASPARVLEVAKQVYSAKLGFEYAQIMATSPARELYSRLLKALKSGAVTRYGKAKLGLWAPVAQREEIERRHETVESALRLVEILRGSLEELRGHLEKIQPYSTRAGRKMYSHAIAVEDGELYTELKASYGGFIDVFLIESVEDLGFLSGYELVRYIQGELGVEHDIASLGNVVAFQSFKESEVLPELIVSQLQENLPTIKALSKVVALAREVEGVNFMPYSALREITYTIASLERGKARIFSSASEELASVVEECTSRANTEIEERVQSAVSIEGRDVLNLLSGYRSGSMYEALPERVRDVIEEVAEEKESRVAEKMGLAEEKLIFSGIFRPGYPLVAEKEKLRELETWLKSEAVRREFGEAGDAAAKLKGYIPELKESLRSALELDFLTALGSFVSKYKATLPRFTPRPALGIKKARHLPLAIEGKAEPVSYSLGDSSIALEGSSGERVAVITGANSGGKTTLLETVAYCQIAWQCGFPVLAEEAELPLLEKLYFFSRPGGSSSAGGLESLLKFFSEIAGKEEVCLILADELEAATEPGAAARVLGAFIEWFSQREETLLALVTHLGDELRGEVGKIARVDGIEAKGLDENLNLIVSRNPVLGKLARSTPELIVERLSRREKKEFFEFLMEKFRGG